MSILCSFIDGEECDKEWDVDEINNVIDNKNNEWFD